MKDKQKILLRDFNKITIPTTPENTNEIQHLIRHTNVFNGSFEKRKQSTLWL